MDIVMSVVWLATVLCLPSAIRGRRRLVFAFLAVFSVTLTLTAPQVYAAVDPWLGGTNVTYFVFHAGEIACVALLDCIVQAAVSACGLTFRRAVASGSVAAGIILVQAALFFGADWHAAEHIDADYFGRWDFVLYACTTWLALAYYAVAVGMACVTDRARQRRRVTRVSLAFIAFSCLGILVYSASNTANAILAAIAGNPALNVHNWTYYIQMVSLLLAPLTLAIGLGLTAVVDGSAAATRAWRSRWLLLSLTPVWRRLLGGRMEHSIDSDIPTWRLIVARHGEARLYRRYVEVRDRLLVDVGNGISPLEARLIDTVEHHIRGRRPRGGTADTSANESPNTKETAHVA